MAFPPKPQPGQPLQPGQKPESDGQVDSYQRIVNGKVVRVSAYGKKSTTTTRAAKKARMLPGRPRMMAQPGSYSSGRDIPGQKAVSLPEPKVPPNVQFGKQPPPRQ